MEEQLKKIENWHEVTHGMYITAIGAKCAYQIIIEYHELDKPIETAKASLCVCGFWNDSKTGKNTLDREWLGKNLPVQELLEIAVEDYKNNM